MFDRTTGSITAFPLPGGGGNIRGLAVGLDGNIWFTDEGANAVGTIDLTTHAVSEFPVPTPKASVDAITAGSEGKLWFIEWDAARVGSIDPTTHAISEFPLPTDATFLAGPFEATLTAGHDGNLWITSPADNAIARFNITTDAWSVFPLPDIAEHPEDITAGTDGNLWFTDDAGSIGTIDPTTGAISLFPLPPAPAGLHNDLIGITTGPDGTIWFANDAGRSVGMIDPTTHAITEFPVAAAEPGPYGWFGPFALAAARDGQIWFTLNESSEIGVLNLGASSTGSTGSSDGKGPASTSGPAGSASPVSPPAADAPPAPGLAFEFTIGLTGISAAAVQDGGTISLTLGNNPAADRLSVATRKGPVAISGLTLSRFDHGAGYRIVAGPAARATTPHGPRAVALPHVLATEELLTAGHGNDKHVVGFRIILTRALESTVARGLTDHTAAIAGAGRSGPVGLQVSYTTPAGIGSLSLQGEAKLESTGQIVVVART
jgi:virginiamycin B lyase